MGDEKDTEEKPGPWTKYLTAAKVIAVLVGVLISLVQSCRAGSGVDRAQEVTNANAGKLESVIIQLLQNDQRQAEAIGELRGALQVHGGRHPEIAHEVVTPGHGGGSTRIHTPDAGIPDRGVPDRWTRPVRSAPRKLKFQLRRMPVAPGE